jgi:hypothetical protein
MHLRIKYTSIIQETVDHDERIRKGRKKKLKLHQ